MVRNLKKRYLAKAGALKIFEVAIINMFEDLKEDLSKCLNEDPGNVNKRLSEITKQVQDMKVEIES